MRSLSIDEGVLHDLRDRVRIFWLASSTSPSKGFVFKESTQATQDLALNLGVSIQGLRCAGSLSPDMPAGIIVMLQTERDRLVAQWLERQLSNGQGEMLAVFSHLARRSRIPSLEAIGQIQPQRKLFTVFPRI